MDDASILKNIAIARGEALAASLFADAVLQTIFAMGLVEGREERMLDGIASFIDGTLNESGPGGGMETMSLIRKCVRSRGFKQCRVSMR